jgi:hypothetical protein
MRRKTTRELTQLLSDMRRSANCRALRAAAGAVDLALPEDRGAVMGAAGLDARRDGTQRERS